MYILTSQFCGVWCDVEGQQMQQASAAPRVPSFPASINLTQMAAPQIPNLLSMRGRGVGRGRGRGRGLGSSGETSTKGEDSNATATKHDQIIQQTDTDANLSRLSAVQAGYLSDPFAAELAPLEPGSSRRLPIINRGEHRTNPFLHRCR